MSHFVDTEGVPRRPESVNPDGQRLKIFFNDVRSTEDPLCSSNFSYSFEVLLSLSEKSGLV